MGKSDLVQKVGGTNTLLVPGSQKLRDRSPPVPMVVAPTVVDNSGTFISVSREHSTPEMTTPFDSLIPIYL
jgi:hypothetical protein